MVFGVLDSFRIRIVEYAGVSMLSERDDLAALVAATTDFLVIADVGQTTWCRNTSDARYGPWRFRAIFEVSRNDVWQRRGEVLYLVSDASGTIRLVGQSSGRLKDRWRRSPTFDCETGRPLGEYALFHSSAWPAIERGLSGGDAPPFTASAIFRPELEALCRKSRGPLRRALEMPETPRQRLSYHVETWVCALARTGLPLWNRQKI